MATVTLTHLWLHLANDPDTYIRFDGGTASFEVGTPGEVRTMANGRRRSVTGPGVADTLPYQVPFAVQADVLTLDGWVRAKELLMLRDVKGRVVWGRIFSLSGVDPDRAHASLSFTFNVVTYDEEL